MLPLFPHRLNRDVVRDKGVALRIAGDAHPLERPAHRGQFCQDSDGPDVLTCRWVHISRGYEDILHTDLESPLDEILQMRLVTQQPGKKMRYDLVSVPDKSAGEVEGPVQTLGGGCGDGQAHIPRDRLDHCLLDGVGGQYLEPRMRQQVS